jgi:hypothetical protein
MLTWRQEVKLKRIKPVPGLRIEMNPQSVDCPYGRSSSPSFGPCNVGSLYCTKQCGYCTEGDWEKGYIVCSYGDKK